MACFFVRPKEIYRNNDALTGEHPAHYVCVDSFYIGMYEVTHEKYQAVMGDFQSIVKGKTHPANWVSWDDAQVFIRKLNKLTDKKYRLPLEAEWEYAARSGGKNEEYAGTSSEYGEIRSVAWFAENSRHKKKPRLVGQKKPNGIGLYDMSGNVSEWCQDYYDQSYYDRSPTKNPKGPDSGNERVSRGGSWASGGDFVRTVTRYANHPDCKYPPVKPGALRLLAPQRGFNAIAKSKEKTIMPG